MIIIINIAATDAGDDARVCDECTDTITVHHIVPHTHTRRLLLFGDVNHTRWYTGSNHNRYMWFDNASLLIGNRINRITEYVCVIK
jgi:hypothetical protein